MADRSELTETEAPPRLSDNDNGGEAPGGEAQGGSLLSLSLAQKLTLNSLEPPSLSRSHLVFLTCPAIHVDLVSPNRKEPFMVVTGKLHFSVPQSLLSLFTFQESTRIL